MRAIEDARAGPAPFSPLYQNTVFAAVPLVSVVALASGVPDTRCGGSAKKSAVAAIADAATSEVLASVAIAPFSALLRLAEVAAAVAPIANPPAGVGTTLDAVSWMVSLEPSGRSNLKLIWSPLFGMVPSVIESAGGDPVGPVTVAPVSCEDTEFSFSPNTEGAVSSPNVIGTAAGGDSTRRPNPPPRSACSRSEISCLNPACAPLPFNSVSASVTGWVSIAAPEKT